MRRQRAELLERFGLDPQVLGRAYSKGNRQKVALVAALALDADLLVLDEPTTGLDPLVEEVFAQCVAERTAAGATVLLSSHVLAEVERLADRVTIVRAGRTVETGSLDDLRHLSRSHVRAEVRGTVPDLTGLPGVHDVVVEGPRLACTVDPHGLSPVLERLTAAGVVALTSTPPTLEELFLDAYREGTPVEGAAGSGR